MLGSGLLFLFVIPVSPNYSLKEINFGDAGGSTNSKSTNYKGETTLGEAGSPMRGATYAGGLGFGFTQMANVPPAPTLTNPSSYYNKLHVVIAPGNNPTDTTFALAISTDGFATTNYIKADTTVGATLALADYQSYATWGSGSGFDVIGLTSSTTYQIKVKALQGQYSESGYGSASSGVATVSPTLAFNIDVSPINTHTFPPYATDMGTLLVNTISTSSDKIWIDFDTNATTGGKTYVSGAQGGLRSSTKSYVIPSVTGDLAGLGQGFGLQGSSATQTSGGPFSIDAPYNGSAANVGIEDTTIRSIFTSSAPITAGRASFVLKAKPATQAPASNDYTETLTVTGAANY